MARSTPIQSNFNGGQISNRLAARVDVDKYRASCKEMTNFLVTPEGPAERRSGTKYVASAADATKKSRLHPFIVSNDTSYILEFSNLNVRMFKDGEEMTVVNGYPVSVGFASSTVKSVKLIGGSGGDLGTYLEGDYLTGANNSTETGQINLPDKRLNALTRQAGTWTAYDSGAGTGVKLGVPFSFMHKDATTSATRPYRTFFADGSKNLVIEGSDLIRIYQHGYETGDGPVRFAQDSGDLPDPLSSSTDYYIQVENDDNFRVALTYDKAVSGDSGQCVVLTNDGSGSDYTATPDSVVFRTCIPREIVSATRLDLTFRSNIKDKWNTQSRDSASMQGATEDTSDIALVQSWVEMDDHNLLDGQGPFRLTTTGGGGTDFPLGTNASTDYYIVRVDKDTFCISESPGGQPVGMLDVGSGDHTLTMVDSGGSVRTRVELATPYTEAELPDIDFVQSADVLYIAHKDHLPHKLSRKSDSAWVLDAIHPEDGPYLDAGEIPGVISMNPDDPNENGTIVNIGSSEAIFSTDDYGTPGTEFEGWGRLMRIGSNTAYPSGEDEIFRIVKIIGVKDEFHAVGVVVSAAKANRNTRSVSSWRLGAFRKGDFPSKVTLFQDRLVFAANPSAPETVYGSMASQYEKFSPSTQFGTNKDNESTPTLSEINDNNAWTYTLGGGFTGQVNEIQWLAPIRELIVGTSGGISSVSTDSTGAVTPSNVFVRQNNVYGAQPIAPMMVEDFVLYVSATGKTVRGMGFSLDRDNYVAEDLGVMSRDLMAHGISEVVFAKEPTGTVYIVRKDGALVTLVLERSQQVAGFSVNKLGGSFGTIPGLSDGSSFDFANNAVVVGSNHGYKTGDGPVTFTATASSGDSPQGVSPLLPGGRFWVKEYDATKIQLLDAPPEEGGQVVALADSSGTLTVTMSRVEDHAMVESVAVIPSTDETHSQVWVVVRRTNNSNQVVRSIEYFDAPFGDFRSMEKATFLDSSVEKYNPAATGTSVTALNHLEGMTVGILGDGRNFGTATVSSNAITSPVAANRFIVGLPYTSTLKTNNFEIGDPEGSSQGKTRRITRVTARLHRSMGGEMGVSHVAPRYLKSTETAEASSLSRIEYDPTDSEDYFSGGYTAADAELFTGDVRMPVNAGWGPKSVVEVSTSEPLPLTVVALIPEFSGSNR